MAEQPKNVLKRKHAAVLSAKAPAPPESTNRRAAGKADSSSDPRRAAQFAAHLQSMAAKKPKRLYTVFDKAVAGTNFSTKRFAMRKPRPHPENIVELPLDEIAFVEYPENNPEARATWMKDLDLSLNLDDLKTEMYILPPRPPRGDLDENEPLEGPVLGPTKNTLIPKWMYQLLTAKKPPRVRFDTSAGGSHELTS